MISAAEKTAERKLYLVSCLLRKGRLYRAFSGESLGFTLRTAVRRAQNEASTKTRCEGGGEGARPSRGELYRAFFGKWGFTLQAAVCLRVRAGAAVSPPTCWRALRPAVRVCVPGVCPGVCQPGVCQPTPPRTGRLVSWRVGVAKNRFCFSGTSADF